jgi:hypothetical protein
MEVHELLLAIANIGIHAMRTHIHATMCSILNIIDPITPSLRDQASTHSDLAFFRPDIAVKDLLASAVVLRRHGMPCKSKKHHPQSTVLY